MKRFLILVLLTCLGAVSFSPAEAVARQLDSLRNQSTECDFNSATPCPWVDIRDTPAKFFALQVFESEDSNCTYTVKLEGSLDGNNPTSILTLTNVTPNVTSWSTNANPVRFVRINVTALAAHESAKARFLSIQ